MNKKISVIVIVVLVVGNIIFAQLYFSNKQQSEKASEQMIVMKKEKKVLAFLQLFVEKVLQAEEEVSFNDRLALETAIRELDDNQIMVKWQAFVDSKNSQQSQDNLKDLLGILVNSAG